MSGKPYGKNVKEELIKQYLEQNRSITSLNKEYGMSKSTISRWIIAYRNKAYKRKNDEEESNN